MGNETPGGGSSRRRFGIKEAGLLALGALGLGGAPEANDKPTEKVIEIAPAAREFVPGKKTEKGLEPGVTAYHSDSWNYDYQDPVAVAEAQRLRELKQSIADMPTDVSNANASQARSSRHHRHHNRGEKG